MFKMNDAGDRRAGGAKEFGTLARGIQLSLRAAVASGLSVALARLFKLQHPVYALLAAVIVTDLSPARTSTLGFQRLIATIVGATCGAALSYALPASAWAITLSILATMLICQVSGAQGGAKVAGYICGIVVLDHGTQPWSYGFNRLVETVLGIAVAWLISFVPKLIRVEGIDPAGQPTP